MYVRGYLQGSENGRVVTIELIAPPGPLRKMSVHEHRIYDDKYIVI